MSNQTKSNDIKLIFSGSGILFPYFSGSYKRLKEELRKSNKNISAVFGTSGGSIIASAIASGYTENHIIQLCRNIVPKLYKLIDISLYSFFVRWGFIKGTKIQEELEKYFVSKFKDVKIPLYINATNFDSENNVVFSKETHPDLDVCRASRASISVPIIFAPCDIDDQLYIDGGVKRNFGIDFFGNESNVIGLYFVSLPKPKPRPKGVKAIFEYVGRVVDMLISAKTEDDIEDASKAIKIPIYTESSSFNFLISEDDVEKMIQDGYNAVDKWIKENPGRI